MELTGEQLRTTPEFRNFFRSTLLIQLLGLALTAILFTAFSVSLNDEIDARLFTAAARVERLIPEKREEIIPILIGASASEAESARGEELLSVYGYRRTAERFVNPLVEESTPFLIAGFLLLAASLLIMNVMNLVRHQKKLYERIAGLSACMVSVLEGKTVFGTVRHEDGIVDMLVDRFNRMVNMLKSSSEKLNREKIFLRNIISDISHQLKTPLATLIMYTDLLSDNNLSEEKRTSFLHTCSGQLGRMEWLIKSLLKLARLETGTIAFESRPVDLIEVMDATALDMKHLYGQRNVIIRDLREKPVPVTADPGWLAEAFGNLLKNAIQHTDQIRGTVEITVSGTPLFQRISFSDNGPGVPAEDRHRIFDRFYKGSSNVDMESVGIGLPLAKMIIESVGGDIRLSPESTAGAEFIITFPY